MLQMLNDKTNYFEMFLGWYGNVTSGHTYPCSVGGLNYFLWKITMNVEYVDIAWYSFIPWYNVSPNWLI